MSTTQSCDTTPDAEDVQIELLRRAGAAGRVRLMCDLSRTLIAASRREIARQMPDADATEVALRWVELAYGRELAEGVRNRLGRQSS